MFLLFCGIFRIKEKNETEWISHEMYILMVKYLEGNNTK